MKDRLPVTPIEASIILLNEIVGKKQPTPEIAKTLHGRTLPERYAERKEGIGFESFLGDAQKSSLLTTAVERAIAKLTDQEQLAVRFRFGFTDGKIHTYKEVGEEINRTRERARQVIAKASRRLRRPPVFNGLKQFIPTDI